VAGEVLTASNINGFLMNQVVAIFADSGARAAAITSPTKGNVTYLQDVDRVERWNGSAWVPVSEPGLIATKTAFFTGTRTQSIAFNNFYTIPETEITHSVAKAGNSVILWGQLNGSYPGNGLADNLVGGVITQNGNALNRADAAGNRNIQSAYNIGGFLADNFAMSSVFMVAKFTPSSTAAITYGVAINANSDGTRTYYINRGVADDNANTRPRGASGLLLMEVTD
jgi:hypothetical protein